MGERPRTIYSAVEEQKLTATPRTVIEEIATPRKAYQEVTVYDTVAETILEKTPRTIRTETDRLEYDTVEETVVQKSPTTQTEQLAREVTTLVPRRVHKDVDVEVDVQ